MKKKGKRSREWWQSAKFWRRAGIGLAVVALLAVGGVFIVATGKSNDAGEKTDDNTAKPATTGSAKPYLVDSAPSFQLPTIDGGETSLQDHLGKHNVLLYFNEGMG